VVLHARATANVPKHNYGRALPPPRRRPRHRRRRRPTVRPDVAAGARAAGRTGNLWNAAGEARAEESRRAAPPLAALGEEPSAVASRAGRAGKDEA